MAKKKKILFFFLILLLYYYQHTSRKQKQRTVPFFFFLCVCVLIAEFEVRDKNHMKASRSSLSQTCMRFRRSPPLLNKLVCRWETQRPPCGEDGKSADGAIQLDTTEEWLKKHVESAVSDGRQTNESAAYFESILNDRVEFREYIQEARRLLGEQDPRQLTGFQQRHYAERLSKYMSGIAAGKMMRAHAEEANARRYTQDGTSTGENYWFEAGNTLASPSVPSTVKDDVLRAMCEDRKKTSPAFEGFNEISPLAAKDEAFAEHIRQQRRRLLNSGDYLD